MVLGFIEHDRGVVNEASFEMLTVGRKLAAELGEPLAAVLIGEPGRGTSTQLPDYGVTKAYLVQHEGLDDYAPDAWAQSIVQLMESEAPSAILASGTDRGNEVLARVAARSNLPLAANCIELRPGEKFELTRIRWGGSLLEEARLHSAQKLITIAPHMIAAERVESEIKLTLSEVSVSISENDLRGRVTDRVQPQEGITLTNAPIVIGGGRGVGSADGFAVLENLAELVGGAVGCSRAVTNNGWRPHSMQVGQTGARITPDLYMACGISGAIQHWVGCMGSKKILVVNTDPEAPIIAKADYAVIGDLHEVLPAICEELRKLNSVE